MVSGARIACRLPEACPAGNTCDMAGQSHPPRILLTRPVAQSQRFARELRAAVPFAVQVTIAPLMTPILLSDAVPTGAVAALIFTSETGVQAYAAQPVRIAPMAYCVGNRTAQAARAIGLRVVSADGDAEALIALIRARAPAGPLLHLRGQDARGDIAPRLTAAGVKTRAAVVYDQQPSPLTPAARRLLRGRDPVMVPLFSPRSARLFMAGMEPLAPLRIVAMSRAVADAIDPARATDMVVAQHPTSDSMVATIRDLLMHPSSA
jgi:uroporphyrinogen-III synthase